MSFVDECKDRTDGGLRWGVESICRVLCEHHLAIAPATYYAAKNRPPSLRTLRDGEVKTVLAELHEQNYGVYGVRKMHATLRRAGVAIGRVQTWRLMRELGLQGVRRGKFNRTTVSDDGAVRPADLVRRDFSAARPDQLWVCDLTYIRIWVGFAYLALVIDVFSRRILGWALATHLRTDLPLEALEMAIWSRQGQVGGLIQHTDRGGQGGFNRLSQHLDQEVLRWFMDRGRSRRGSIGGRSRRLGGRRWLGARTGFGSGRPSLAVPRPRMRVSQRACLDWSGSVGSVTLAA